MLNVRDIVENIIEQYVMQFWCNFTVYEPAGLALHPPPPKRSRVGLFFSHRCLVLPNFFTQRKGGFCRRYSHWNTQKCGFRQYHSNPISTKLTSFDNNE